MPIASLPDQPSLEQLRNQARELQRAVRTGDPAALAHVAEHGAPASRAFSLSAAQRTLARHYGFASWATLRKHVEIRTRYTRSPGDGYDDPILRAAGPGRAARAAHPRMILRWSARRAKLSTVRHPKEIVMPGHTYRVTEVVGTSAVGVDDAIKGAIGRAARTLRGLDWFEVTEIRGHIEDGQLGHVQVAMKVGFRLEGPADD